MLKKGDRVRVTGILHTTNLLGRPGMDESEVGKVFEVIEYRPRKKGSKYPNYAVLDNYDAVCVTELELVE